MTKICFKYIFITVFHYNNYIYVINFQKYFLNKNSTNQIIFTRANWRVAVDASSVFRIFRTLQTELLTVAFFCDSWYLLFLVFFSFSRSNFQLSGEPWPRQFLVRWWTRRRSTSWACLLHQGSFTVPFLSHSSLCLIFFQLRAWSWSRSHRIHDPVWYRSRQGLDWRPGNW